MGEIHTILNHLAFGFGHALTLQNLMFVAIGCTVGTLVGLLPGLGPLATISLLLPLTFSIPTGGALIMLAGIIAMVFLSTFAGTGYSVRRNAIIAAVLIGIAFIFQKGLGLQLPLI